MPSAFASVKLPSTLVDEARLTARQLRRSVASQIEYWATLGRVVEHSGLTVQEAQCAIAAYESATQHDSDDGARRGAVVAELSQRIRAASTDGSLGVGLRDVIADNRRGGGASTRSDR